MTGRKETVPDPERRHAASAALTSSIEEVCRHSRSAAEAPAPEDGKAESGSTDPAPQGEGQTRDISGARTGAARSARRTAGGRRADYQPRGAVFRTSLRRSLIDCLCLMASVVIARSCLFASAFIACPCLLASAFMNSRWLAAQALSASLIFAMPYRSTPICPRPTTQTTAAWAKIARAAAACGAASARSYNSAKIIRDTQLSRFQAACKETGRGSRCRGPRPVPEPAPQAGTGARTGQRHGSARPDTFTHPAATGGPPGAFPSPAHREAPRARRSGTPPLRRPRTRRRPANGGTGRH